MNSLEFRFESIAHKLGSAKLGVEDLFPESSSLVERTEIPHVWQSDVSAFSLALSAAQEAIDISSSEVFGIGAILYVTQSPSQLLPAHACLLQDKLGLPTNIMALDINQGCSGFVQALTIAVRLLHQFDRVLIVTADRYREKLSPQDRSTSAIFSDAASATIISKFFPSHKLAAECHFTDGSGSHFLSHGLDESNPYLHMNGREVFLFTRRIVMKQLLETVQAAGMELRDIDYAFLHQASGLVLNSLKGSLRHYEVETPSNIGKYGNTVSSSIPILLQESLPELSRSNFLVSGFGVGLSASSIVATCVDSDS